MNYKYWFVHNPISGNAPRVMHPSRAEADKEAMRLAAAKPGIPFFVLETVAAFSTERPRVVEISLETAPNGTLPVKMGG